MLKFVKSKHKQVKQFCSDLAECISLVNQELKPNCGSSIKDSINRIDRNTSIVENKQRAYFSHLDTPIWESDKNGNRIWANAAYLQLIRSDLDSIKNYGWLSTIHPDDREDVEIEWRNCIKDARFFNMKYRIIDANDVEYKVHGEALPVFDNNKLLSGFIGTIKVL